MPPVRDPFADLPDVAFGATPAASPEADPFAALPDIEMKRAPEKGGGFGEVAEGVATNIVQGATLGLADEGRAAVQGAKRAIMGEPFGDAYDDELTKARDYLKGFEGKYPKTAIASQIAGGLALPVGSLGSARTLGGAIGKGAALGGALGGATGFGQAEGGAGPRLEAAAAGGALGAAGGAVLGPVAKAIGAIPATALPGPAGRQGMAVLREAVQSEAQSPQALSARIGELNRAGVRDVTLADVAQARGPVQTAAADVMQSPNRSQGPLREFIASRQKGELTRTGEYVGGQMNRVADALADATDTGGRRAAATAQQLADARRTAATPLFAKAHQFDPLSSAPVIDAYTRVMQSGVGPELRGALNKEFRNRFPGSKLPGRPDMRVMQTVKEMLDDKVTKAYREGSTSAKPLQVLRDGFRDTIAAENPAYGQALKQYAGDSALKDALDAGRKMFSTDADEAISAYRALSPGEQEQYRVGAISALTDTLRRNKPGPSRDYTGAVLSPDVFRRVKELLPDDAARVKLTARLTGEEQLSALAARAYGSQTSGLREASQAVEVGAIPDRVPLTLAELARTLFTGTVGKARQVAVRKRREAIGKALMLRDGEAQELLRRLETMGATGGERLATTVPRLGGLLSGVAGPRFLEGR